MQNILVTGAGGQLGQELQVIAKRFPDHHFIFADREKLDITDRQVLKNFFQIQKLHFCINCAAYTAVDKAEEEYDLAFEINADAVEYLAKICSEHQVQLIHISTDFVFDGTSSRPYNENEKPNAINAYGQSKLSGEEKAMAVDPKTIILRTSWVYSTFGKNFVKTMLRLGQEKKKLKVVYDQIGTPTYAADLAEVIMQIITSGKAGAHPGIYHYSNEGVCSWYDLAKAIFEIEKIDIEVEPVGSVEFPTPAKRPNYSVLNRSKIKRTFDLHIPYWRDSLKRCLQK